MPEWGLLRAPQQLLVGRGCLSSAVGQIAALGKAALIITDQGVRRAGLIDPLIELLIEQGLLVSVYDTVLPEFDFDQVADAASYCEHVGADIIIGFGGGSSIDMAKLVALQVQEGGDVRRFVGEGLVPSPTVPVVAIPTTAGTGSEVTPVAVATDSQRAVKAGVSSQHLVPTLAVVDSTLSDGCPPRVTAASGIDALTHAIESFTSVRRDVPVGKLPEGFVGKNSFSDLFALKAIELIGNSLATCVTGPTLEARDQMAYGSTLAGLAFAQSGTGLAHALQYPIGKATQTSHGVGVGLLLPYVMKFVERELPAEMAAVGAALPQPATMVDALSPAIAAVVELREQIGIPHTLDEIGGNLNAADVAAEALKIERLVRNSGRQASLGDLEMLVEAALIGDLNAVG